VKLVRLFIVEIIQSLIIYYIFVQFDLEKEKKIIKHYLTRYKIIDLNLKNIKQVKCTKFIFSFKSVNIGWI
jgi:hypothetical protein